MENQINYQIYPSLLDSYARFKRHNDEESLNNLLATINKEPRVRSEQALKGIAFEECVNASIDLMNSGSNELRVVKIFDGGESFEFNPEVIRQAAGRLKNATQKQEYIEAVIDTPVGNVKLYGIIDYRFPNMIADLKGSENYSYGQFEDHAQHTCYSIISKANGQPISAFKYVISDYRNVFVETYIHSQNAENKFISLVVEFCRFLDHMKKFITNGKVFGKEELELPVNN